MQRTKMMIAVMLSAGLLGLGNAEGALSHPRLRSQALKRGSGLSLDVDDADVSAHETGAFKHPALLEVLKAVGGSNASQASSDPTDAEVTTPSLADIESVLTTLEAEKKAGKATPGMENFVATVTKMIDKELIPEINFQHITAKRILRNFKIGFASCGNVRKLARANIKALKVTRKSTSTYHQSCRKIEDKKYVIKDACQTRVAQFKKKMDIACGAFSDFKKDPSSEASNCHTTNEPEPYGLWLTRNRKQFQATLKKYRKLKLECLAAKRAWRQVFIPCTRKTQAWINTKSRCNKRQLGLETAACTVAKKMKDTCTTYETCYDQQLAMYNKQKPKIMVQEKDRKTEFRALMRIKCLLVGVFGGEDVDTAEIDKCKAKTHSTKHLDLIYPEVPDKKTCEKRPPIPGEKLFKKLEYMELPMTTKTQEISECVLTPAGGVLMGLQDKARKDKCRIDNGWLLAQNGGSCLISGIDGIPVQVDYTKRRFTKYRFTMKLDETNPRNGQSEGGGFEICNLVGTSSLANGKDPMVSFVDGVKSLWGYHLLGGFSGVESRSTATCKDLLVNYKVWGRTGRGIDVSKYTRGKMKWIGCMGDGCSASSFFCNDLNDGIVFGSPGTLRGLLGNKVPSRHYGCCSRKHPDSVCNAMDKTRDINYLCKQLGYSRGTVLAKRKTNWCPEVSFEKGGWSSDFVTSHGYGNKFRCQGPTAKALYTNKKYYKAAEPKAGKPLEWDLTMEYKGGKLKVHSLKIQGVSFSGYRGSMTTCPAVNKKFAFSPRIGAFKTGKVWIKNFRVFQGNSAKSKKMVQTVGQGVGLHAEQQKKKLLAAALAAAKNMARCSLNGHPRTWRTRHMLVDRTGTIFRKNPRVRRGWNTWAMLPSVKSIRVRIISRKYQHAKIGLTTRTTKPHLGFPGGRSFGIYPRGRLWVQGMPRRLRYRKWRYGDSVAVKIQGRNYCSYHNNRKLRCWRRAPKSGKATAQMYIHEAADGVQLAQVCTAR